MSEWDFVDSTNIEKILYDEENQDLHVQFISGELYIYHQVSEMVYHDFLEAPSKGSYFNREIKSVYQFSQQ
jgi:lysyl-tRNA synthetase class 2